MAPERNSSSASTRSGSPHSLSQAPANSHTTPSGPARRTANVGVATLVVVLVTMGSRGNGHAKRCDHRPLRVCCGDSHLARLLDSRAPRCHAIVLAGQHLLTGWHGALTAGIECAVRPKYQATCSGPCE